MKLNDDGDDDDKVVGSVLYVTVSALPALLASAFISGLVVAVKWLPVALLVVLAWGAMK